MPGDGSITCWIERLKEGDRAAVQKLWEGYYQRLVKLAHRKLRGASRAMADEEDVATSAFDSFCRRAQEGRFPRLNDRDDLWELLVLIASRKAINWRKRVGRRKHGADKVQHASALGDADAPLFAQIIGREPDPAFAAEVAEECQRLLGLLDGPEWRSVAVWKMEGCSNEDIARKLGKSVQTVERKLKHIRGRWQKEVVS